MKFNWAGYDGEFDAQRPPSRGSKINLYLSVNALERLFAPMRERKRIADLASIGVREIYPEKPS